MERAEGSLVDLAARVIDLAREGRLTLATAESCTGGLVGHLLTEVPGSSDAFRGSVVAYADEIKRDLLGVPASTLSAHGAVSAQTAVAMAEGARAALGVDIAVSVTGIAGPAGGSPDKPVGLTYIAIADGLGHEVRRCHWSGDRHANKLDSAEVALALLADRLPRAGA